MHDFSKNVFEVLNKTSVKFMRRQPKKSGIPANVPSVVSIDYTVPVEFFLDCDFLTSVRSSLRSVQRLARRTFSDPSCYVCALKFVDMESLSRTWPFMVDGSPKFMLDIHECVREMKFIFTLPDCSPYVKMCIECPTYYVYEVQTKIDAVVDSYYKKQQARFYEEAQNVIVF